MGHFVETVRGAIPPWECDVVEHFTVAYYFDKLDMATAALLEQIGISPLDRQSPRVKTCDVRYLKELRAGDLYRIESGVMAVEPTEGRLKVGHRFFNAATDSLCTAVSMTLAGHLPSTGFAAFAESWEGPNLEVRPPVTDGRPRFQTVADVVQPFEVDWRGELKMSNYIHRFSSASAHTMAQFGMTPAYCREHRVGLSTFEFQLKFLRAPQSGDRLVGETLVAHVGSSSLRFITTLKHASSQEPCAELSQMGVHLDMDARRASLMSDALADAGRALTVPNF